MQTIFGVFESLNKADEVIGDLLSNAIEGNDISIITTDTYDDNFDTGLNRSVEGVAIGPLAEMLAEITSINVSGVGEIFIVGPAATLLQTDRSGGLSDAFKEIGIEKSKADEYVSYIKKDYVIVGVTGDEKKMNKTQKILDSNGALALEQVSIKF